MRTRIKRHIIENECNGKRPHPNKESAYAYIDYYRNKNGQLKSKSNKKAYKCYFCKQWHIATVK